MQRRSCHIYITPALQMPLSSCLGGDEKQVMIHISDRAGGIPFDATQRVWSYLYTTAKEARCTDAQKDSLQEGHSFLAGYGIGLPVSRHLYAS